MTTNFCVLAFDPGGSTGWASYSAQKIVNTEGEYEWYEEKWLCGTLGPDEHHSKLWHLMEHMRLHEYAIVSESFEFRQGKQRGNIDLMAKEYIGVIKLYGQLEDVPVKMQTAAMAKTFIPDKGPMANKKLRAMGLWEPGVINKHAMDARRHLVYYLVNRVKRYDLIESWKDL